MDCFSKAYLNILKRNSSSKKNEKIVQEEVSAKDAFLNKLYDLIDTAYHIGIKAGKTGEEINPHEDEEISDILGSIEADYDNGNRG